MEVQRDNISLFFEEKGKGSPPLVLIHGTGGSHLHLKPQFDYFSKQRRVVNVDLRGHGKSDKPKESYTIEKFADDIHFICQQLHLSKPVLVGFSMGGNIAIDFASRYPGFASSLVILDSAFLYTKDVLTVLNKYLQEMQSGNLAACIHQIVENGLLPTDQCKEYVEKSLLLTPPYVWASSFEHMIDWDSQAAPRLKKCSLPMLYIEAAHQMVDKKVLQKLCPQIVWGKVVGSGHSLTLEVPVQVNAMIEKFLALQKR